MTDNLRAKIAAVLDKHYPQTRDRAKFPVKVTLHKIEHWVENPLLAAE